VEKQPRPPSWTSAWGARSADSTSLLVFSNTSHLKNDGVIYGSWWFNDGSNQPTTSSSSAWTPDPTPTSTSTTSSTTTSYSTLSTTPTTSESSTSSTSMSSTTSASSAISATSVNYSTGAASGIAVPTGTVVVSAPDSGNPQNLLVINGALVKLGVMLSAQRGS